MDKTILRPKLAMWCILFGMFYTTLMSVGLLFGVGPGADASIIAAFIVQPIAWVASRGYEKVKSAA